MIETLKQPWPWYIAGPLIGLMVPALLLIGNKQFGVSSTLRDFCTLIVPNRFSYFNYDLKEHAWRNLLVLGALIGGALAVWFLPGERKIDISVKTAGALHSLGIHDLSGMVPVEIFALSSLISLKGIIFMVFGGLFIGFGTRWADGCTSGHAIMGLSLLSPASFLAVMGFFGGGLTATHFLFPLILN